MNSSRAKKPDPFYKPHTTVQKTSAEIINEARNSLRTLKTQRPFTPRDVQRKLFGHTSSWTPDNRSPSSFSIHSCNFECPDSRPVSGTRLSPLPHMPKLPLSPAAEGDSASIFPQPPLYPAQVRRTSISRSRLLRATSHGNLSEYGIDHQEENNKQKSEEENFTSKIFNEGDWVASSHSNLEPLHLSSIRIDPVLESPCSANSKLQGDPTRIKNRPSSCPSKNDSIFLGSKTGFESQVNVNESETEKETSFWNEKISPILQTLEAAQQDRNLSYLCRICAELHKVLEDGNMLGKRCKRRAVILKTLFKLVEMGSDTLCLSLAKLILALKVSGKNLLNVSKLIFKISRSENNDCLFQNDNILDYLLEMLQSEDAQANSEAFLYCMAAIKFLSGNTAILNDLLRKQAVEILVNLMKQVVCFSKVPEMGYSSMGHLLVQLTATLRNLADLSQSRPKFLASNALLELCLLLESYVHDKDICTNVSRILSKLSSYNDCCLALADCSRCYSLFLSVLNAHPEKQDLVVRIVFTIGNLTAKNNKAREKFSVQNGSIQTLLRLLQMYHKFDINVQPSNSIENEKTKDQKRPSETEDVLIKLILVLANLSIHPAVGTHLAANQDCIALLLQVLEYKSIDECEELVINTVATINNLSYYDDDSSIITVKRLEISKLLLKLLLCNNMDGILEAARVFGNLSRYQDVRDFIVENSVYKFMVALLDAKHQEVCFSACGVLINLTADHNKRALLKEEDGVVKLVDCLRDFGRSDWQLAGLVCKALWNFSENVTTAELCFGVEETKTLVDILSSLLDERLALDCRLNGELMEYHKSCWEIEFKPVASQLIDRIQRPRSYLEPLPTPV